jgi:hypothetical protein
MRHSLVVVAVLLAGSILVAWALRPARQAGPCLVVQGPTNLPDIPEASGLAISRRTPGVIWAHNDSGNAAVLFALDESGAVRGRVRLPIRTRDWEDISAAPCPSGDCLYVADIGDNSLARGRVQIYRVPEPSPDDTQTERPEVFSASYADGAHNAEAAFVVHDYLFVVTRDRTGGLYRSKQPIGDPGELTLERIGEFGLAAVTDAEASPDAALIVVRTSHEAVFYRAEDLARGVIAPALRVPIDGLREPQGEGVALDQGGMLYLASEGRPWNRAGRLIALSCAFNGPRHTVKL